MVGRYLLESSLLPVFENQVLLEHKSHLFIHVLSVAAFLLQQQSSSVC